MNRITFYRLIFIAGILIYGVSPLQAENEHKESHDRVNASVTQNQGALNPARQTEGEISHYTCGMHPSVRVSVENYNNGDTKCPICSMPLTPVKKGGVPMGEGFSQDVISQVNIALDDLRLAGVESEPVVRRRLHKEIRTVGTVAFDPRLAVAQEEFLSSYDSFEKAKQSEVPEITERAERTYLSAWNKLKLLGLNDQQIAQLEEERKVQSNLVLPEDKMWVYGEVYEQEIPLVKEGSQIKVTSMSLPGEELTGTIHSINPVVNKKTRTVTFRALIDNPERALKPQMYVDVYIATHYTSEDGQQRALSVPKSALLDTGRRKIVWVDNGSGQFEGRKVMLGPELASNGKRYYPVISGLREGEMVVTKGNFLIDSQSQITGVAASAFGGALGDEGTENSAPVHSH